MMQTSSDPSRSPKKTPFTLSVRTLEFTKMHGLGNDYIYINGFDQPVDQPEQLAQRLSDRHFGIGADGLIFILPPDLGVHAHVRMRIFNADGSEAQMCGNGIRCVCKLSHDHGLCDANPMLVQTDHGVLTLQYTTDSDDKVDQVTVDMGAPILETKKIPVEFPRRLFTSRIVDYPLDKFIPIGKPGAWMEDNGMEMRMTCLSMGNPHMVIYCQHVDGVPLKELGPFLERQNIFPERINVHFVQVDSPDEVTMRTWERGSGATLGCGTGAAAVCVAGALTKRTDRQLLVHLPGGDLALHWDKTTDHVFMTGPAKEVFTGRIELLEDDQL